MKTKEILLALLPALLLLFAVGCSNKNVEPNLLVDEPNLTSEFGGYSTASASPAFGDDQLLDQAYASDEEFGDPMLASPAVTAITSDSESGLYHMRILWGRLRYDSTHTSPTDWTGSLTITRGAEIVRRVINFERGQDYIVQRTDRKLIEWVSQTTVHNDGIAVDLFIPPQRPGIDTVEVQETDSLGNTFITIVIDTVWPAIEPVTVAFTTGPYSNTFNLDDLAMLDTIVTLDDSNAVAFHAFKLDRIPCPRGFLAGHWSFGDSSSGFFRGVWLDRGGRVVGFTRGHFGQRDNGEKVFFGKWVSREGRFEGFVKGRWGFYDGISVSDGSSPAGGFFRGQIFSADRVPVGVLAGHFRSGERISDLRGGFFQGRWKIMCPDENRNIIEINDGLSYNFQ